MKIDEKMYAPFINSVRKYLVYKKISLGWYLTNLGYCQDTIRLFKFMDPHYHMETFQRFI